MKYLPLRSFESITAALNFRTSDCVIQGGCDLYTTKAASSDKRLYKHIDTSLESQYESLLRLSASLSPPQAESFAESMNLSRSSPFGPLSQVSSRRTFAYLIATLNASHPDYDFSQTLRPTDFCRDRYRTVLHTINSTFDSLRPGFVAANDTQTSASTQQIWGPKMWTLIDREMDLKECAIYSYSPEEDPFDGEDGSMWSMHYFFFNKQRRRVCYFYLRGSSIVNHPESVLPTPASTPKRKHSLRQSVDLGSHKRARYWFGDRVDGEDISSLFGDDDDEVEIGESSQLAKGQEDDAYIIEKGEDSPTNTMTTIDLTTDDEMGASERAKSLPRAVSEGMVEGMEV